MSEWEAHIYFIPSHYDGFHILFHLLLTTCSMRCLNKLKPGMMESVLIRLISGGFEAICLSWEARSFHCTTLPGGWDTRRVYKKLCDRPSPHGHQCSQICSMDRGSFMCRQWGLCGAVLNCPPKSTSACAKSLFEASILQSHLHFVFGFII